MTGVTEISGRVAGFHKYWEFLGRVAASFPRRTVLRIASSACCLGRMVRFGSGGPVLESNDSSTLINLILSW